MFKLIKKLKNKISRKSKKTTGPKPLAYSAIWIRVCAMDNVQRDAAWCEGFTLATRGTPGAQLLTGHRIMETISMVNMCIDIHNGDEEKGLSLAREQLDDYYMNEAEGKFDAYVRVVEEEE